jgi:hypothetical protein
MRKGRIEIDIVKSKCRTKRKKLHRVMELECWIFAFAHSESRKCRGHTALGSDFTFDSLGWHALIECLVPNDGDTEQLRTSSSACVGSTNPRSADS